MCNIYIYNLGVVGARAQVFRTYNASVTLDALLHKESSAASIDERKAEYDRANKEARGMPKP